MRKLVLSAAVAVGLLVGVAAPANGAADTTPRAHAFYEIWCTTATGDVVLWKRVDAHAIDPGGVDAATENFNANNPYGEHCEVVGPIAP